MRIGIFGGTFNPIHYGHLINAEIIRNDYSLDKIIFIPAKIPVHKELAHMISTENRLKMVQLAIKDNKYFETSDIEINRETESYTIVTLKELMKIYLHSTLYLIIGADSLNEIDKWLAYEEILKLTKIIVMRRQGDNVLREDILKKSETIMIAENPIIEISSTHIREMIKNGNSVKYLLPGNVINYINKKELYTH